LGTRGHDCREHVAPKASTSAKATKPTSLLALQKALLQLITKNGYGSIRVQQILTQAGIARSTFYEHVHSKDALLASCLISPLRVLVKANHSDQCNPELRPMLAHFWENKHLMREMLSGISRRKLTQQLSELHQQKLCGDLRLSLAATSNATLVILTQAIAEMQMCCLGEWLLGRHPCTLETLALAIETLSRHTYLAAIKVLQQSAPN
jgi:AcrR family transcriptional regulator